MNRTVEVYAGAYASGKSETAVNRARQYIAQGKSITLVDLDTVEPAYTLRPLAAELEAEGMKVITQPDYFGLGEAGSYITPAQQNALSMEGDLVIDVGYGASGLDMLDILTGIDNEKDLQIYIVINTSKFETFSVENIIEYVTFSEGCECREWKHFSGIISNTHFGDETTKEDIIRGYEMIKKASEILKIPVRAIGVDEKFTSEFGPAYDGVDVWLYKRSMPKALW
ncbi:MAG: hypothetical protein LBJ74_03130 [Heliobacteriaceae bacterium]|jgi:hypothetical protein|nr:hypothetical protein [Heliobacteriaceae bacterium]